MKLHVCLWALMFIFGMGPGLEAGAIYQWIDKDGVHHFTNEAPPPGSQIVQGTSEIQSDEPPADTDAVDGDADGGGDDADDGDAVVDNVVVEESRRRYPEADRDAVREDYREEGRPRPETPRRRR